MEPGMMEMREMLIELKLKLQHLSQTVDLALLQSTERTNKLEQQFLDYQRTNDAKVYALERNLWLAVGAASAITTALPYIIRLWEK
jgi:hypothetical protein